jgi:hypothetical protein
MKTNKARSVESIREARKVATSALPAPPVELSERATAHYAEILAAVPVSSRQTVVARSLASAIAEAIEEGEIASRILRDEGYTVQAGSAVKAHPMLAVRDAASRRTAALSARLKLLPSDDLREATRAAAYEASIRGGTAPVVAGPLKPSGATDWVEVLKKLEAKEKA